MIKTVLRDLERLVTCDCVPTAGVLGDRLPDRHVLVHTNIL